MLRVTPVPQAAGLLLSVILVGCTRPTADGREAPSSSSHDAASSPAKRPPLFVDVAETAGLRFSYDNGMAGKYYFPEMLPAGVALFDMDNDGDLDIYFTQGRNLDETPANAGDPRPSPTLGRLFRNDLVVQPDGSRAPRFADVTEQSGIRADAYGMGVAAADMDNDGCVDLYLTHVGPNQLLRNNCDGTFTDVSRMSRTDDPGWAVSAAFFDFDRDGWLDLYVGNYVRWEVASDLACTGLTGRRDYCTPAVYRPQGDRLFHNDRNGTFTDVTASALKGGPYGPALGVTTADFDNDGWQDVYVANDGRENVLWMNQRDGSFKNVALLAGAALAADGRPKGSMGVDAGDFDNDGDEDLFTTQLPTEGNNLYVNDGRALFDDRSAPSGLGPASRGFTGFGTAWFDYDNDGWLDLFVANGAIEAIRERTADPFPYGERKLLFRNDGNGTFEDTSSAAGPAFSALEVSRGAAFGDLDNDGDTDIVVVNIHAPARVLINQGAASSHWVGLRVVGMSPGRDMIGSRVEVVRPGAPTLVRRSRSDGSYATANDPRVLVGLGEDATPPTVRVRWPDGRAEEWTNVTVDRWTVLRQGEGAAR
ncbi:MAG: CRTAC1 family protein [Vicinamibacterales bacterium]